jgi:hypothetical protein
VDNEPHEHAEQTPEQTWGTRRPEPRLVTAEPVQRITTARSSHSEDVGRRMRNYAISMGIRTLCVIGLVVVFPHWTAWLFVPGAVLLPYVAVLLANAGRERTPQQVATLAPVPPARPALGRTHDDAA